MNKWVPNMLKKLTGENKKKIMKEKIWQLSENKNLFFFLAKFKKKAFFFFKLQSLDFNFINAKYILVFFLQYSGKPIKSNWFKKKTFFEKFFRLP